MMEPSVLTTLVSRGDLEKIAVDLGIPLTTPIGTPVPTLNLATETIKIGQWNPKKLEKIVQQVDVEMFPENLSGEVEVKPKKPLGYRFPGTNIIHSYNYRSGWYALRVVPGREKSAITKLVSLVNKKRVFISRYLKDHAGKGYWIDLQKVVKDIGYPLHATSNYTIDQPTRGYLLLQLDFSSLEKPEDKANYMAVLSEAVRTIDGVYRFIGSEVTVAYKTELVLSYKSGRLAPQRNPIKDILPSIAKDKSVSALAKKADAFSHLHKDDVIKPGYVGYTSFTAKSGSVTYTKIVVTSCPKDNFTTVMVRKCGKKDGKNYPVLRDQIISIAEYRDRDK
jgi:hypothetical protein